MLGWAILFLILAVIAGLFDLFAVASLSFSIAKVLFVVFLVLFVVTLIFGRRPPAGA